MLNDYINVLVLFLVVGLGAVLAKKNWLGAQSNVVFTKLLLNVALPSTLILSITGDFTRDEFLRLLPDVALPVAVILTLMVLAAVVARLVRVEQSDRGLFIGLCAMSSTIFFGIPVTLAVYGNHGLPYALMTYASQTVIYWTLGLYLLERDAGHPTSGAGGVRSAIKQIINMPLVAFFVGVFILVMGVGLPDVATQFLSYLGGMTSALAMLVIGTIIYLAGFRNIRINRALVCVVLFRFVVAPAMVVLWGYVLSIDAQMTKITILICSLPIPNTTVILAQKYNTNVVFATESLTFSIAVYLVFLPVILFVVHAL